MKRILTVATADGWEHEYTIISETEEIIETNSVTLFDEYPLRFNKREERMEYFNGAEWDVYFSDEFIQQVDITEEGN